MQADPGSKGLFVDKVAVVAFPLAAPVPTVDDPVGVSAGIPLGDDSVGVAQTVPNLEKFMQAEPMFQQGDKVMIYGLESKKELNENFGILLQFDPDSQRWKVELMTFGTSTGKRVAIKPSNLRACYSSGALVFNVPETFRRMDEQEAFYSSAMERAKDWERSTEG